MCVWPCVCVCVCVCVLVFFVRFSSINYIIYLHKGWGNGSNQMSLLAFTIKFYGILFMTTGVTKAVVYAILSVGWGI